jgi:multidrug efflux pump subunit AcrB
MNIVELAVKRWQLTLAAFLLALLLGANAFFAIPRSVDPHFPIPLVLVTSTSPGADATEIEETIAKPMESALQGLDNVREIRSVSSDGLVRIAVDFTYGTDAEQALDRTTRVVNAIRSQLPTGIGRLDIRRARTTEAAVVQLALVSPNASWRRLDKYAQDMRDRLEVVPGVRSTKVDGLAAPEVQVELDNARLAEMHLPAAAVANAVAAGGIDLPAGAVQSAGRRLNVDVGGAYRSLEAVRAVPLRGGNGQLLTVGAVAQVDWGEPEQFHLARYNGKRAVFISILQKDKSNALKILDDLRPIVAQFKTDLPPDIVLEFAFDQSRDINRRLEQLATDFLIALALVLITLLPLGLRASLVVMISIPTSLAIGLFAMYSLDFTLDQLSISGFIVALGLLVDDSIVVTENIERHLRMGKSVVDASTTATKEISLAVLGSTGVLIFAFLPLAYMPEMAGDFIRGLPMAVLVTVASSLLVSLTIVPFVASRLLKAEHGPRENRLMKMVTSNVERFYRPLLRCALDHPKKTFAGSMAACLAMLCTVPLIGFSLFPTADVPYFMVRVETPEGSSLAVTNAAVTRVATELDKFPQITARIENVGRGNPQIFYNSNQHENDTAYGEILVMIDKWMPSESGQLLEQIRNLFADFPDAKVNVVQFDQGTPVNAPIEMILRGPNLDELKRLSGEVAKVLETHRGTRNIVNPVAVDRIDLDLRVDVAKAGLLNVSPDAIRRAVRLALSGEAVSHFRDAEGDSYPVVVRMPFHQAQPISALNSIYVTSLAGVSIPLAQLTSPEVKSVPPQIRRHQLERSVIVSAYVKTGYLTSAVTADALSDIGRIKLPPGYTIVVGGEAEAASQATSGLGTVVPFAIFGIFAVLIAEFGRFREVAVVAGVIPLGLFGGLVALLLTGYSLSFLAIVGFVALVGIEIKNSILLVDFTNQLRQQGLALRDAIEDAGEIRFLPVLLTSVTAIGGLMPLAVSGAPLYAPLAWVIIGGLVSSTLLSRIVTPVMYLLVVRGELPPVPAEVAPPG